MTASVFMWVFIMFTTEGKPNDIKYGAVFMAPSLGGL